MIDMGLATPGMVGMGLGLAKCWLANRAEDRKLKRVSKIEADSKEAKSSLERILAIGDSPWFIACVGMFSATICASVLICIDNPSIPLRSIPPDAKPVVWQFWLFRHEHQRLETVDVTTGGVAYDILQAMVLQIGYTLTGRK